MEITAAHVNDIIESSVNGVSTNMQTLIIGLPNQSFWSSNASQLVPFPPEF